MLGQPNDEVFSLIFDSSNIFLILQIAVNQHLSTALKCIVTMSTYAASFRRSRTM